MLIDATTLRNFSCCDLLPLLETVGALMPGPHWTDAVRGEIELGRDLGRPECPAILIQTWLDEPVVPDADQQKGVMSLWIALNRGKKPPKRHAGEAQSIFFAEQFQGSFATDDNGAHAFAERRLGAGRVHDTVDILKIAVGDGLISPEEAVGAVKTIRAAGRHLRRIHPPTITAAYFT